MCYVHNQWYDISCATLYIDYLVYHVNVPHLVYCLHAQEVALGSDEWYLSSKIMIL